MKKLLIILAILPAFSFAQVDTTKMRANQAQVALIYMRDNLNQAHKQYRTGSSLFYGGLVLTGVGVLIPVSEDENGTKDYGTRNFTIGIGALFSLIGSIVMIDSHKYIGRAGKWKFSGNSITYDL